MGNSCIGIVHYQEQKGSYQSEFYDELGYVTNLKFVTLTNQVSDNVSYEIYISLGTKEFELSKISSFKFKLDFIVGGTFYEVKPISGTSKFELKEGSATSNLDATELYKKLSHLIFSISD